jgi:hypothetical protein
MGCYQVIYKTVHFTLGVDCQTKQNDTCTSMFRHASSLLDALFCWLCARLKYHKCYFSEVYYILSQFCSSHHHAKKVFINQLASLCHLCGEVIFTSQRRNFTPLIKKCWALKPPLFWHSTLRKIPEKGRSLLHRGGSLISCPVQFYFECNIGDHGKSWAPPICCIICIRLLNVWKNG